MKTANIGSRRRVAVLFSITAVVVGMLAAGGWAQDSSTPPIAWWKLDESSGPNLADSAHGLYPLTLNGDSPTATVGTEDVPVGMPAGSKSIQFKGSTISRGEYATRAYTAASARAGR